MSFTAERADVLRVQALAERRARAVLKADVHGPTAKRDRRGALTRLASVLRDNPPCLQRTLLWSTLGWVPLLSDAEREAFLEAIGASTWKIVGELTDRQRNLLCDALEGKS